MRCTVGIVAGVVLVVGLLGCVACDRRPPVVPPVVVLQPPDADPPTLGTNLIWSRDDKPATYQGSIFDSNGDCELRDDLMNDLLQFKARELPDDDGVPKDDIDVDEVTLTRKIGDAIYQINITKSGDSLSWNFRRWYNSIYDECDAMPVDPPANPTDFVLPLEFEGFKVKNTRANGYDLEDLEWVKMEFEEYPE